MWEDTEDWAMLQPFGIFAFIRKRYSHLSLIILPEFSEGSHLAFS